MNTTKSVGQSAFNLLAAVLGHEGFNVKEMAADLKQSLTDHRDVIIVGEGYWGRGVDETSAMLNYKAAGGSKTKYIVYDCPVGTYVDGMGGLVYPNAASILGFGGPKEVRRHGFNVRRARRVERLLEQQRTGRVTKKYDGTPFTHRRDH